MLGLLNHITEIGNQLLALSGEVLRWGLESSRFEETVEGDIDLLVRGDLAGLES